MAASADKKDKFQALREAYRAALPARLAEIRARWDVVRRGHGEAADWQELHRLIHSIAGSAGTFGFSALGVKARELEEVLVARAQRPEAGLHAAIESTLAALGPLMEKQDAAELPAAVIPSAAAGAAHETRRVFVIEDDLLLAQEIADQLGRFDWKVRLFHNASEAGAALRGEPQPDAVVVDLGLAEGKLAGAHLMQQTHDAAGAPIPHVVISTRWDWQSRLEAARAGAAAYLTKPIDFGILAQRLDAATRRRPLRPHRVLIVEDTVLLAEHYAAVLGGAGMKVKTLTEPSKLLDALAEFDPGLILMDLYMPGCSGIEAARVIRQDPKCASLPIVFLSTESARQQQIAAMQTGADDFLQKPIRDADLVAAVSVRAERFREIAALIRQDSLTGLLNHISFKLQLESEIERSRRAKSTLALAMIDIDHFKRVNDSYGHPVGDQVIRALSELLRRRLRQSDVIGRYGGEEFVVLMPDTAMHSALEVIDALRGHFEAIRYVGGQDTFGCSFSAGLAALPPLAGMDELIRAADAALYEAKRAGRNCIRAAAVDAAQTPRVMP